MLHDPSRSPFGRDFIMRRAKPQLSTLAFLAAATIATAHAEPKPHGHSMNLSISPIHLLFPVAEVQAELYVHELASVALIGGYGQITATRSGGDSVTFDVLEVGGQARAWFYGSSQEGAMAGVEVLYLRVDGEFDDVTGVGAGAAISALAGYRWVWNAGFLIDLNGGVSYLAARAEATDGEDTDTQSDSQIAPALNFNLGWAF